MRLEVPTSSLLLRLADLLSQGLCLGKLLSVSFALCELTIGRSCLTYFSLSVPSPLPFSYLFIEFLLLFFKSTQKISVISIFIRPYLSPCLFVPTLSSFPAVPFPRYPPQIIVLFPGLGLCSHSILHVHI